MHVQRRGKNFICIDLYTSYGIYQTKFKSLKSIKSCLHLREAIVDYCLLLFTCGCYDVVAIIYYDNGLNCPTQ